MSVSSRIQKYLEDNQVNYEIIDHEPCNDSIKISQVLDISSSEILRCALLQGTQTKYMAVLPADHLLDFEVLRNLKKEDLKALGTNSGESVIPDCQQGCEPAIPEPMGFVGLVEEEVFHLPAVYVRTGDDHQLLKLPAESIARVFESSERLSFSCGPDKLYTGKHAQEDLAEAVNQFTPMRIKQRIDETFDLPAMPDIAQDIMRLRVDPAADAKKLASVVSRDPSLTAQIISWASSPYYGYKGTVDSVETAISRVLGFDLVMNLALGISIGKSLNVPDGGLLGLKAYWQKAVYAANLVEKLCIMIPVKHRPERGLAYLAGLLHNFGQLLIGHLFPPQFSLINGYVEVNPNIAIEDVEYFVLGVTHQEIGAWLMQNWHMPEELIVAVRWHSHEEFWSNHAVYSNLVLLSNRLLKRIQLSASVKDTLPANILESLSLDESRVNQGFEKLLLEREALDVMSKQLVA